MKAGSSACALTYVLVTAARDEAAFIERTLQSVVTQTILPLRWIVVSDGSTDATDEIVRRYAARHAWIELLRLEGPEERSFASKAQAFNVGWKTLRQIPYDVVGNLDADISFDEDLFAFLLGKFSAMPELGVAGARVLEGNAHYDYRFTNIEDVSGSCQLFRRACLEAIGGYAAVEGGGIDCIAVTTARMKGWTTRTFVEKTYVHHRPTGSADRPVWEAWFRRGEKDYALGGHPLWQLVRSVYQSTSRPYVFGGVMLLTGYASRWMNGTARAVPPQLAHFRQAEQMRRLKNTAARVLPLGARRNPDDHVADLTFKESIARLERWVEAHEYKGHEPFDGLSSPLSSLTFGNQLLQRLLQQLVRQSPINLRPLLGIKPLESTKGRGYMASGYLILLQHTGKPEYRRRAVACLDWLIRNRSPLYSDYSWGNHFDYASRAGKFPRHASTLVWTSLIGQTFVDAYESLRDERYLDVAAGVCRWILKLPREASARGTCLSYLTTQLTSIHNANLLGAAMLARTAKHTGDAELLDVAAAAVEYSCSRQLADGAWYYGEDPRYRWIDSFHTGYNLDSLKCFIDCTGDQRFHTPLDLGFRFFRTRFFEPDGRPRYYSNRAYPIDIQCASQGIETLAKFADHDPDALATAVRVARWTIRNMQHPTGYFSYRRYPGVVAKIPMLHWGQATMYRALALLLLTLGREAERARG